MDVKDNQLVSVEEEEEGGEILRQQIRERKEGCYHFIDSWHAGTNPKTVVPWDRNKEPRAWWNYAHWSPLALHFHLGRSVNPITLCCFNETVWVDDRKIYEDGKLAILDDVGGIAKRYSEDLFANKPLPV